MIGYQSLVDGVREQAGLADGAEAGMVAATVLNAVTQALPPPARAQLAGKLPGSLRQVVDVGTPIQDVRGDTLITAIGDRLGVPAERARYLTQSVLAQLVDQDAELIRSALTELPTDVADTLRPAGARADQAVSVDPGRPLRLGQAEVAQQLRNHPNWTGDEHGIERTVALPDDRIETLVNRVQREARTMNDHAAVTRADGEVTFRLRTGAGYVTEADFDLAARIDAIVADFGSGG